MKWLFGLLVLANVALYMWGSWYHKPLVDTQPPTPRPPVAAEKMKLLSEPGVRLVLRAPAPASASATADDIAAAVQCYRLGPFAALDKAQAAGDKLDDWGLGHTRVAEFQTVGTTYRVYLPPLASKAAAERKRRELSRLGFTDHALIQQEAGMENAISLGIFSVAQNARARAEQLARKGVRAAIQPIPNVQPVYWLTLLPKGTNDEIVGVPLARFKTEDWGAPDVALRPLQCAGDGDGDGELAAPDVTRPGGRR